MSDAELLAARGALKLAQVLIDAMARETHFDLEDVTLQLRFIEGGAGTLSGAQVMERIEAAIGMLQEPDGLRRGAIQ